MQTPWSHRAALAAAVLSLAACATSGLYQPHDGASGYAETRLSGTQWRVEFVGDDYTARQTVETYLLFRAAELTTESRFEWFAMSTAISAEEEIVVEAERPEAYRARYWRPHWRRRNRFYWSDVDTMGPNPRDDLGPPRGNGVRYSATAEIVMGDGAPPVGAFNAQDTIRRLETSIVRPHS